MFKVNKKYTKTKSILFPLKTPENLWFSGVFRVAKMDVVLDILL